MPQDGCPRTDAPGQPQHNTTLPHVGYFAAEPAQSPPAPPRESALTTTVRIGSSIAPPPSLAGVFGGAHPVPGRPPGAPPAHGRHGRCRRPWSDGNDGRWQPTTEVPPATPLCPARLVHPRRCGCSPAATTGRRGASHGGMFSAASTAKLYSATRFTTMSGDSRSIRSKSTMFTRCTSRKPGNVAAKYGFIARTDESANSRMRTGAFALTMPATSAGRATLAYSSVNNPGSPSRLTAKSHSLVRVSLLMTQFSSFTA